MSEARKKAEEALAKYIAERADSTMPPLAERYIETADRMGAALRVLLAEEPTIRESRTVALPARVREAIVEIKGFASDLKERREMVNPAWAAHILGNVLASLAQTDISSLPAPAPVAEEWRLRPMQEWHEEIGAVLWYPVPVEEPPYCGTPLDDDWPYYEDFDEESGACLGIRHRYEGKTLMWQPLPPLSKRYACRDGGL